MKHIALAVLVLSLGFATPLHAEDQPRLIHVNAADYVEAVPDEMLLSVVVKATRPTHADARKVVDDITNDVIAAALKNGVKKDELDSSQLSAYRESRWDDRQRRQVFVGNAVQRGINLTLRDIDDYARLLAALSELDLHSISQPQLQFSNLDELRDQALRKALDKARERAELIAAQSGVKIGRVHSVQDQTPTHIPRSYMESGRMMSMAAADAAAPSHEAAVNFGKQRISASVGMSFEID